MDLAAIVAAGMSAIPVGVKCTVTVTRPAERGAFNRETSTYAAPTTPTSGYVTEWTSTRGVMDAVKASDANKGTDSGGEAKSRFREISVPALDVLFTPENGMEARVDSAEGSQKFRVVSASPVAPSGVAALWTMRVEV